MGKSKDIYQYLSDKGIKAWDNAENCHCNISDCAINHKLCALCHNPVIFGAYEAIQPNSRYNWNVDHIIPKVKFNEQIVNIEALGKGITGANDIRNLQITHVDCNNFKGNKYNSSYANGYGILINPKFD